MASIDLCSIVGFWGFGPRRVDWVCLGLTWRVYGPPKDPRPGNLPSPWSSALLAACRGGWVISQTCWVVNAVTPPPPKKNWILEVHFLGTGFWNCAPRCSILWSISALGTLGWIIRKTSDAETVRTWVILNDQFNNSVQHKHGTSMVSLLTSKDFLMSEVHHHQFWCQWQGVFLGRPIKGSQISCSRARTRPCIDGSTSSTACWAKPSRCVALRLCWSLIVANPRPLIVTDQKGTLWRPHFYGVLWKSLKSIFGHYIIKCSLFWLPLWYSHLIRLCEHDQSKKWIHFIFTCAKICQYRNLEYQSQL